MSGVRGDLAVALATLRAGSPYEKLLSKMFQLNAGYFLIARDIAMQKIANRVKGARMASEELGV